jgi:Protein of unknown function (DUF2934)
MNRQATSEHKGHGLRHAARHGTAPKRQGGYKAGSPAPDVAPDIRRAMIAEAAYFLAEKRGFSPGDEIQDWLEAESQIESLLRQGM